MDNSKRVNQLLKLSEEMKVNNLKALNLTTKDLADSVKIILEWFWQQPHLPDIIPDSRKVENIYISCKGSMERTKSSLDMYYTIKTAVPDIFNDRDPLYPEIRDQNEGALYAYSPTITHNRARIFCVQALDPEKFNGVNFLKRAFMLYELKMLYDHGNNIIGVLDMSGVKMGHLLQVTPFLVKITVRMFHEALVTRIKGIHFVSPPLYADVTLELIRSLLSPKLKSRVYIHKTMDDLHNIIDKQHLPKEFGGEQKPLKDLQVEWNQALIEHRDWFLEEDKHKSDESRRPGKPVVNELMDLSENLMLIK